MKSARLSHLLASTAVALTLVLSSQAADAQQQLDQQQLNAAVPMPDTTLPPPPTAKDIPGATEMKAETPKAAEAPKPEPAPVQAAEPAKAEPASVPVKDAKAPAEPATPTAVATDAVADALRELITSKQFDRIIGRKPERAGAEAYYKQHNFAPIWVADGLANARAKAAIDTLGRAFLPNLLRQILSSAAASTAAPAISSMLIYLLMAIVLVVRPEGLFPATRR